MNTPKLASLVRILVFTLATTLVSESIARAQTPASPPIFGNCVMRATDDFLVMNFYGGPPDSLNPCTLVYRDCYVTGEGALALIRFEINGQWTQWQEITAEFLPYNQDNVTTAWGVNYGPSDLRPYVGGVTNYGLGAGIYHIQFMTLGNYGPVYTGFTDSAPSPVYTLTVIKVTNTIALGLGNKTLDLGDAINVDQLQARGVQNYGDRIDNNDYNDLKFRVLDSSGNQLTDWDTSYTFAIAGAYTIQWRQLGNNIYEDSNIVSTTVTVNPLPPQKTTFTVIAGSPTVGGDLGNGGAFWDYYHVHTSPEMDPATLTYTWIKVSGDDLRFGVASDSGMSDYDSDFDLANNTFTIIGGCTDPDDSVPFNAVYILKVTAPDGSIAYSAPITFSATYVEY